MNLAKETFSTAGSKNRPKLLSLRLLRAHLVHKYLLSAYYVLITALGIGEYRSK